MAAFCSFEANDEHRTTNQAKISCPSGKTPTEAVKLLQEIYGDETMLRTQLFEWYKIFKEERKDVENDSKSGRPPASRTDENVEHIKKKL